MPVTGIFFVFFNEVSCLCLFFGFVCTFLCMLLGMIVSVSVCVSVLPRECAAVVLELKKRPSPRSPSFTSPVAVMNTLAGLMSISKKEQTVHVIYHGSCGC